MRIRELEIDRFGVWRDVTLPLDPHGVSVFYGPNEAGKSTLMRFVRGVLYGFQSTDGLTPGPQATAVGCGGALRIDHDGQQYRLHRKWQSGTRGQLEINGRPVDDADPLIESIRGGAGEALFQNVYAIGLHELQQLATLNGEDVAQHVYGLSLGPDGQRILNAQKHLSGDQHRLLGDEQHDGEMQSLLKQLDAVEREIAQVGVPSEQHAQLQQRQIELEEDISSCKRRQHELKQNHRGYQFIQRAWGPWTRERELRRQLDGLPRFDIAPEMLDRFDELELEVQEEEGTRRRLTEDSRRLLKQAAEIRTRPEIEEHVCRIQNLFDQQDKIAAIQKRLSGEVKPVKVSRDVPQVQPLLARIDPTWTIERLQHLDVSPKRLQELLQAAGQYRRALRKRARAISRYKRRVASTQKLQKDYEQRIKRLDAQSPQEARTQLQKRIAVLEELSKLKTRRDQLSEAAQFLSGPSASQVIGQELPPFFWTVLWFFAAGGILLLACGLYAAGHSYANIVRGEWSAALIGAIYGLMGLAALALAYTMRQHFTSQSIQVSGMGNEQERLQQELERIDESIDRLTRRDALRPSMAAAVPRAGEAAPVVDAQLLARLRQELIDLQGLEAQGERIERRRKKLSAMRQQLQDLQRDVSRRRRDWSEGLRQRGLTETLKIEPAIQAFAQLTEAKAVWQQAQLGGHDGLDRDQQDVDEFHRQVEQLGQQLHGATYRVRDYARDLAAWEKEVREIAERRKERLQLRKAAKEKQAEAKRHSERLQRLQQQRKTLLARLGVTGREEITDRLETLEQRAVLDRKLQEVRADLMKLSESEPELAVVDDHFRDYSEADNKHALDQIKRDLEEVDVELQLAHEELGRVKHELREVEDDRQLTSLRFDRAQIHAALKTATDRWSAARVADQLVGSLRERIEKTRQPRALKRASEYLQDLTLDRYQNIWTPLEGRTLVIDDDQKQSLRIEQLSSGTREQVFLAIRMAMIDGLGEQGLELPLVLDDVTVNFDQIRSEAAVKTLLQAAEEGQQVLLFTCHLHLMQLFQANGVEAVCLPGHSLVNS